jgi:predicted restriction endonuclease
MSKEPYLITNDKIILFTSRGEKEFKKITQVGCTLEILIQNENIELTTQEITSEAASLYNERTSEIYAEMTGRHVRGLREKGFIQTTKKGVFKFTGKFTDSKSNPFSKKIRDQILARDKFTCVLCGATKIGGANLTADHIKPQDKDGEATVDNGQCLCTQCENRKANYGVMEFGSKMFKKYLKLAEKEKDKKSIEFFKEILSIFKKHKII